MTFNPLFYLFVRYFVIRFVKQKRNAKNCVPHSIICFCLFANPFVTLLIVSNNMYSQSYLRRQAKQESISQQRTCKEKRRGISYAPRTTTQNQKAQTQHRIMKSNTEIKYTHYKINDRVIHKKNSTGWRFFFSLQTILRIRFHNTYFTAVE